MRRLLAAGVILVFVGALPSAAALEERHRCGVRANPLWIDSTSCGAEGHLNFAFTGHEFESYFHIPGAQLQLAIYEGDSSVVWGDSGGAPYEPVQGWWRSGTGSSEDPYVLRSLFTAGDPVVLEVEQFVTYVKGRTELAVRHVVQNISDRPVHFRASLIGDTSPNGASPSLGRLLPGPPRVLQVSSPRNQTDCCDGIYTHGRSVSLVEVTPWDAFAYNTNERIEAMVRDGFGRAGPGFDNVVQDGPTTDGIGVQWDDFGLQGAALAPLEKTSFEVVWRATNDLVITPQRAYTYDSVHRLTISTRFAEGGPLANKKVSYVWEAGQHDVIRRGSVTTNERGVARLTLRGDPAGHAVDDIDFYFDDNRNRKIDYGPELVRAGVHVTWGRPHPQPPPDEFYSTVSIAFDGSQTWTGLVRSAKDRCLRGRTVVLRRAVPGDDPEVGRAKVVDGRWQVTHVPVGEHYFAHLLYTTFGTPPFEKTCVGEVSKVIDLT